MRVVALSSPIALRRVCHAREPRLSDLGLIAIGCTIFVLGMNSVLIADRLLSGGTVGMAMPAQANDRV